MVYVQQLLEVSPNRTPSLSNYQQVVIDSNWRAKAELRVLQGRELRVLLFFHSLVSCVVEFCPKFVLVRLGQVTDFGLAKKLYTASHFSQLLRRFVQSEACARGEKWKVCELAPGCTQITIPSNRNCWVSVSGAAI